MRLMRRPRLSGALHRQIATPGVGTKRRYVPFSGDHAYGQQHDHQYGVGWIVQASFHLLASPYAEKTPQTEVLAVVREQPVIAFAEARGCALRHFRAAVSGASMPHDHQPESGGKAIDRYQLDRAAAQAA
ncbi:hypothetical protein WI90_21110 [Burkholderia ubonensis]|nr:hypothetical protein WI90_21110 [Burkholderia ubonensis]